MNRGGRRKGLDIGGDRMERTRPGKVREIFYDNIECQEIPFIFSVLPL